MKKLLLLTALAATFIALAVPSVAQAYAEVYSACTIPEYNYYHPPDCVLTVYQFNGYYWQQFDQKVLGCCSPARLVVPRGGNTFVTCSSASYGRYGQTPVFWISDWTAQFRECWF